LSFVSCLKNFVTEINYKTHTKTHRDEKEVLLLLGKIQLLMIK
jgi:hypothetical protein